MTEVQARLSRLDWQAIHALLDEQGWATIPSLLSHEECDATAGLYGPGDMFRSHVVMARHGFGRGEYRYFAYPLPSLILDLRTEIYGRLVDVANSWQRRLGQAPTFPLQHSEFLACCHAAGQNRPTPLLLSYGADDYNCLHQDIYGDLVFPLQIAVLLSAPGEAFSGGEFVLTEQRPRMQSRVTVVPLGRGDAVIFAVNQRPQRGTRGDYRVAMRHGVSRVRSGERRTLGIIFHDAK